MEGSTNGVRSYATVKRAMRYAANVVQYRLRTLNIRYAASSQEDGSLLVFRQ